MLCLYFLTTVFVSLSLFTFIGNTVDLLFSLSVPLQAYLSSPEGLPKSPQPISLAIFSHLLALWARMAHMLTSASISYSQLGRKLRCEQIVSRILELILMYGANGH